MKKQHTTLTIIKKETTHYANNIEGETTHYANNN